MATLPPPDSIAADTVHAFQNPPPMVTVSREGAAVINWDRVNEEAAKPEGEFGDKLLWAIAHALIEARASAQVCTR